MHCSRKIWPLLVLKCQDYSLKKKYTATIRRKQIPLKVNPYDSIAAHAAGKEDTMKRFDEDMWFSPVWDENMNYFMLANTAKNEDER